MPTIGNYTTTALTYEITQEIYPIPDTYAIFPYASYVAIACVLLFALFIIIARLVIRVDGQQSDLILFNKSPQKHLLLLVSKQLYNTTAAQNNITSAIANGLMEPPTSKLSSSSSNNTIKNISLSNIALTDISAKTSTTTINSISRFEAIDSIETVGKGPGRRSKW
jgi:hypothetical protein